MARKLYDWSSGVHILDHSRRKHKILREYILNYLTVRCKLPQQERFRLAIVDGFAGGGRYEGGAAGSPLIIIEQLKRAIKAVNVLRVGRGIGAMEIRMLSSNWKKMLLHSYLKSHRPVRNFIFTRNI